VRARALHGAPTLLDSGSPTTPCVPRRACRGHTPPKLARGTPPRVAIGSLPCRLPARPLAHAAVAGPLSHIAAHPGTTSPHPPPARCPLKDPAGLLRARTPAARRHCRRRAKLPLRSHLQSRDLPNTSPRPHRSSNNLLLPHISSSFVERPIAVAAVDPLRRPCSSPVFSPRHRTPANSWEPLDPSPPFPWTNSGETSAEFRCPRRPFVQGEGPIR
jgi:hypothetical protein